MIENILALCLTSKFLSSMAAILVKETAPFQQTFVTLPSEQGSHSQGKVSEKWKKFRVREKSGNFELGQGILKFLKKSGKSQEIL